MTIDSTPPDSLFATVQRALAGQYSLERELGRGGMGVVYLAREVELDRNVALKVLPPQFAGDRTTRERFLREARMAGALSHPNVVPIHRVGENGDVVFFSMAFIDGGTLGDRLRDRGPLSPSAATKLLREVAQALAYAHGRAIVHRDIKPDNILIERESGRALVSDFGIAAASSDHTPDGAVMGSAHFMSPEQAAGLSIDARSDIYSLGVVGYLSLSGRLPAKGESLAIASPSTPQHTVRAIDRAIERDPGARFENAEAFADALESRSMARVELPKALQEWLDARDPWRLPYVGWILMTLGIGSVELLRQPTWKDWWLPVTFSILPLIPASLFQLRIARRVFDAGYTIDDMRDALTWWRAEHADDEARLARPPRWHTFARGVAWAPIAAFLAQVYVLPRAREPYWLAFTVVASFTMLATLTAINVPIFPRMFRAKEKSLSQLFWNSRFGSWVERVLMRGEKRMVASHAFRPTERILGSAVEELFHSLPDAFRAQLGDVPGIIERLQAHAKAARESLVHFDGVSHIESDAALAAARNDAREQLTQSVSALETIRLDLLRLVGGDLDLRPTTTVLDAARRVDSEIARLHRARQETERVIRPIGLDLRPHTPT
jgi:serine/threonine-protein kinase